MAPSSLPYYLTASSLKREFYALDPYFREGWEDAATTWGSELERLCKVTAAIVFKPEAVVGRRIERALVYLRSKGLVPVAAATFTYTRHIIREAWRFQLNVATRQRLAIVDILELATPSLFVIFRDETCTDGDAAARLSSLKGSSIPSLRSGDDLRFYLGNVSVLINYVHTPDDAADLIRELSIYFPETERLALLSAVLQGRDVGSSLDERIAELYSGTIQHDLSFSNSVSRAKKICAAKAHEFYDNPESLKRLNVFVDALNKLHPDSIRDWRDIFNEADALGLKISHWDKILIATQVTESNIPNVLPIL
jgi:Nucleoside diphosphate kinase